MHILNSNELKINCQDSKSKTSNTCDLENKNNYTRHFTHNQSYQSDQLEISCLKGTIIDRNDVMKFLGIWLVNWEKHLE